MSFIILARWLDLTLSAMDPDYLAALQTYTRALAGRNSLLRRPDSNAAKQLPAFDRTLAPAGARIVALRRAVGAAEDRACQTLRLGPGRLETGQRA